MRILVDTNILLRIAQPGSPHHHDALAALDVLEQAGHELCLVPQVVYEYLVAATRPVNVNGLAMTAEETRTTFISKGYQTAAGRFFAKGAHSGKALTASQKTLASKWFADEAAGGGGGGGG